MPSNSTDLVSRMRVIGLFKEFNDETLQHLADGVRERIFKPGDLFFREGDPGEELYCVVDGELQMYVTQPALGLEREVRRIGPGGYFGEIAVLTGRPRLASVRALTAGRAWALSRSHLVELVQRIPMVGLALCRGMAGYLEQARREVVVVPFVALEDYSGVDELQALLPPRVAALCQAIVIARDADHVRVALVDPHDEKIRSFLENVLRSYRLEFAAIAEDDYKRHRDSLQGALALPPVEKIDLSYIDAEGKAQSLGHHETADLLQRVLGQALASGASDVHFEPGVEAGRVRMRVEGNMFPLDHAIAPKVFTHIISRIKVMSELDITNHRLPQDGRISLQAGARRVETRVSITPCQGGEKVVLRLLDPQRRKPELNGLMHSRVVAGLARDLFVSPSGLVLVCGPTGSGKTTTLYAGLHELWETDQTINITTVEDPVEYHLEFATQIGVDRVIGLGFPQILRTILRQDPDVVLIGEIRDEESAAIAVEAALTGHLVLSSLHTDFALDAIARLRNLHVKPYLLAAALRGVICQRLLPRICAACAQPLAASDAQIGLLESQGILEPSWTGTAHRGQGCDICRGAGELGRAGAYEILTVSDQMRDLIERNAPWSEMSDALTPQTFLPMIRYARFLIEEHLASPERIRELFPKRQFAPMQRL